MITKFYLNQYSKKIKKVIFFLLFFNVSTYSYSDVFRVENVIIQQKFSSSKDFREDLINKAIVTSFEKLSRRIMVEQEFWKIKNIESSKIAEMVSNVSIVDERMISSSYQMTFSIFFDDRKVKSFFNQRGIIYTESISRPILTFPVIKSQNSVNLWNDNFFIDNWNNSLVQNYLVDFMLPEGDLTDQKNVTLTTEINSIDISRVLKKYGLNNSLVVLINLDSENENIAYKLNLENTHYFKKFSKKIPSDNSEKILVEIIDEIKNSVENTWKNKNTIFSGSSLSLEFVFANKNLKNLNKLRNTLVNTNSIKEIKNLEISSNIYKGKIYFIGTIDSLQRNLKEQNITLKESFNTWVITIDE